MNNPFEQLADQLADLTLEVRDLKKILTEQSEQPEKSDNDPLSEYIPAASVRDKLASASTLWRWQKSGKLKVFGVSGKRFYKRSDIENLFTEKLK